MGPLRWNAHDALWLSGHGGELGRAFYWPSGPPASPHRTVETT